MKGTILNSWRRCLKIIGDRITLRQTTEADLPDLLVLWNDGQVMRWVGFPDGLGYNLPMIQSWYSSLMANPDRHHFVISNEEIGFCGEAYYGVNRDTKRASLDIKLIPTAQGQGIATIAFKLLIDHIFFKDRDVDIVWTEPWPENLASQRLYERCGLTPRSRPDDLGEGPSYWELRRSEIPE